jgi:hypothetical protein
MIKFMNWGTKIVLGMATFMIFIVVLGLIMFNSKKDALVDNDYYEKGINYNKVYNRKEQTNIDHAQPEISVNQDMIIVKFVSGAQGTARLMRTSDKDLDKTMPFESNINRQLIIPARNLKKGAWRLIIEWVSNEKSYMYEQEITL